MKLSRALPLVIALTGCGTLFNGGPAHVNFTSTPEGAEVSIDGVPRGRTPIVLELPKSKDHTVLFRLAGYDDIGGTLNRKVSAGYVVLEVGSGARRYSFVPGAHLTERTLRVGRHFNCQEQPLATRAPELAAHPHVGVRLQPPAANSCLETWNATFVFDTAAGAPRLVAVLYDQWEW